MRTRFYWLLPGKNIYSITQTSETDDINTRDDRSLEDIGLREKYTLHPHLSCKNRRRKGTLNATDISIECQFSKEERRSDDISIEFKIFSENSEGNGKIINGSFFLEVCRRKIDRDATSIRERISCIFESTSNAFSTLLDRGISESHNGELTHTSHDIHLDFYKIAVNAIH